MDWKTKHDELMDDFKAVQGDRDRYCVLAEDMKVLAQGYKVLADGYKADLEGVKAERDALRGKLERAREVLRKVQKLSEDVTQGLRGSLDEDEWRIPWSRHAVEVFCDVVAALSDDAPAPTEHQHPATHRCKVCGALWWTGMMVGKHWWSLRSEKCGPCCDNSPEFPATLEPLAERDYTPCGPCSRGQHLAGGCVTHDCRCACCDPAPTEPLGCNCLHECPSEEERSGGAECVHDADCVLSALALLDKVLK